MFVLVFLLSAICLYSSDSCASPEQEIAESSEKHVIITERAHIDAQSTLNRDSWAPQIVDRDRSVRVLILFKAAALLILSIVGLILIIRYAALIFGGSEDRAMTGVVLVIVAFVLFYLSTRSFRQYIVYYYETPLEVCRRVASYDAYLHFKDDISKNIFIADVTDLLKSEKNIDVRLNPPTPKDYQEPILDILYRSGMTNIIVDLAVREIELSTEYNVRPASMRNNSRDAFGTKSRIATGIRHTGRVTIRHANTRRMLVSFNIDEEKPPTTYFVEGNNPLSDARISVRNRVIDRIAIQMNNVDGASGR